MQNLNTAQCWGQGTTPGLGWGGVVPISDYIRLAGMLMFWKNCF